MLPRVLDAEALFTPCCLLCRAADILYVTGSTPSITFKAAMDKKSLRLMALDMPGELSFGDILTGLGVSGAASLGDIITVSATTVLYVPNVNGSGEIRCACVGGPACICVLTRGCAPLLFAHLCVLTAAWWPPPGVCCVRACVCVCCCHCLACAGVVDDTGVALKPGLRLSSVVSVPALSIPPSQVDVAVDSGNGAVKPNISMQWTSSISPVRFVNLTGVTLTVSEAAGMVSGWQL